MGAAGINVTMMLLAVLGLDKGPASASTEALSARKETYWPVSGYGGLCLVHALTHHGAVSQPQPQVFADYDGFYDVYCLAFQLFQFHWVLRDAKCVVAPHHITSRHTPSHLVCVPCPPPQLHAVWCSPCSSSSRSRRIVGAWITNCSVVSSSCS